MNVRRPLACTLALGFSASAFIACSSSTTDDQFAEILHIDAGVDAGRDATTSDSGPPSDAGIDSAADATDAADATPFDAGLVTLQFDPTGTGSPDALYWDDAKQVLYIVDDQNNQVWTYTDALGFVKYATVPDVPALDDAGHTKLNGVTELPDGTLVVTRFGYGGGGAIYTVSPDGGSSATVPDVDGGPKRIEVTYDPATGVIYGDAFTGTTAAAFGEIDTVNLDAGVTPYASGFGKTVGLLVQNGAILVSDQSNNVILSVPTDPTRVAAGGKTLADGGAFPVYASLVGPDQLSAGPDGTIFTDELLSNADGGSPQVRQISADGGVTVPYPTVQFTSLSDVAYDPTGHRIFVADTNGNLVRTIKILAVAP